LKIFQLVQGHGNQQRDGDYRTHQVTMAQGGQAAFSSTLEPLLTRPIVKESNGPVVCGELQTLGWLAA